MRSILALLSAWLLSATELSAQAGALTSRWDHATAERLFRKAAWRDRTTARRFRHPGPCRGNADETKAAAASPESPGCLRGKMKPRLLRILLLCVARSLRAEDLGADAIEK